MHDGHQKVPEFQTASTQCLGKKCCALPSLEKEQPVYVWRATVVSTGNHRDGQIQPVLGRDLYVMKSSREPRMRQQQRYSFCVRFRNGYFHLLGGFRHEVAGVCPQPDARIMTVRLVLQDIIMHEVAQVSTDVLM